MKFLQVWWLWFSPEPLRAPWAFQAWPDAFSWHLWPSDQEAPDAWSDSDVKWDAHPNVFVRSRWCGKELCIRCPPWMCGHNIRFHWPLWTGRSSCTKFGGIIGWEAASLQSKTATSVLCTRRRTKRGSKGPRHDSLWVRAAEQVINGDYMLRKNSDHWDDRSA